MRPSEFSPGPQPPSGGEPAPARPGTRILALLPFFGFVGLAAVLGYELMRGGDPSYVPSALIGRKAPHFNLSALKGVSSAPFSDADLRQGHVTLVNVFASWCVPCRTERGSLLQIAADPTLKAQGVRLAGIAYKDDPAKSRAFLADGNPYAMIGVDQSGRASINWGVYGVPETYIVKGDGTITYKLVGPITSANMNSVIRLQIAKAEK